MILWYMLCFAAVALVFNRANKDLRHRGTKKIKHKTYKQARKDWAEFQKKHPPKS